MSTNFSDATDQINTIVMNAVSANYPPLFNKAPILEWTGRENGDLPPNNEYRCRTTILPLEAPQTSLSSNVAKEGNRRYTEQGVVIVQIFAPRTMPSAYEKGGKLAEIVRNGFRKARTPGDIWFRNSRINPLKPDDSFYRFNVVADFQYDEIC